ILITLAPWLTAKSIADASCPRSTAAPWVSPLSSWIRSLTRTGTIVTPGARPTKPTPVRGRAAMRLATPVPCPMQSNDAAGWWSRRSRPPSTLPCSWGCFPSTPESITATLTPAPVLTGQIRCGSYRLTCQGTSLAAWWAAGGRRRGGRCRRRRGPRTLPARSPAVQRRLRGGCRPHRHGAPRGDRRDLVCRDDRAGGRVHLRRRARPQLDLDGARRPRRVPGAGDVLPGPAEPARAPRPGEGPAGPARGGQPQLVAPGPGDAGRAGGQRADRPHPRHDRQDARAAVPAAPAAVRTPGRLDAAGGQRGRVRGGPVVAADARECLRQARGGPGHRDRQRGAAGPDRARPRRRRRGPAGRAAPPGRDVHRAARAGHPLRHRLRVAGAA